LDKDPNTLLFYLNAKEELVPAVHFPAQLKKRSIYFLKRNPGKPVLDKLDSELVLGDLAGNALDYLSTSMEEIFSPMLSNNKALEGWPEVVATDVLRHFHQLNGSVYVISGKSKVFVSSLILIQNQ
jgi:dynein heavy chain